MNDFLNEGEENYKDLRNNLSQYKNIFQCVYSNVFPEIYCSTERRGFNLKSNFHIIFETYKDKKKKMEAFIRKNPHNYEEIEMKHVSMNKNRLRLMILKKVKKKKLKRQLKNESKKKERSLKIISSLKKEKNRG